MTRRVLVVVIYLLVGVVVNIAVAWACAARSETRLYGASIAEAPSEEDVRSIVESMDLFDASFQVFGSEAMPGFGVTRIAIQVGSGGAPPTMAMVLHTESGWPTTSLQGNSALVGFGGTPSQQYSGGVAVPEWLAAQESQVPGVLPLRPMWAGFIANTVVWGFFAWLLIRGPLVMRGLRRRSRGQCPSCKYPMGESSVCTECGKWLGGRGLGVWLHRARVSLERTRWGRLSKRYLPSPVLALLLGALVNVGVAWSCTVWAPEGVGRRPAGASSSTPTEADIAWWRRNAPPEASPDPPSSVQRTKLGSGKEQLRMTQSARREPTFTPGGVVIAIRAGWPMYALEYSRWKVPVTQVGETVQGLLMVPKILPGIQDPYVPLRPIALGFAVNTVVYATGTWIIVFGPFALHRLIRRSPVIPRSPSGHESQSEAAE